MEISPTMAANKAVSLLYFDAKTTQELGPAWVRALLLHWRGDKETFVRVATLQLTTLASEREKGWAKEIRAVWIICPTQCLIETAKTSLNRIDEKEQSNFFAEIVAAQVQRVKSLDEAKLGKELIESCGYSKRLPSYLKSLKKLQVKGLQKWLKKQQPKQPNDKIVKRDPFAGLLIENGAKKMPPCVLNLRPKDYRAKKSERLRVYRELLALCKNSPTAETLEAIDKTLGFPRKLDDKSRNVLQQLTKVALKMAIPLGTFSCVDRLVDGDFVKSEAEDKLLALAYKLLSTSSKNTCQSLYALIIGLVGADTAPRFSAESFRTCFLATLGAIERVINLEDPPKEVRDLAGWTAQLIKLAQESKKLAPPLSCEERKQLWSISIRTYALSTTPAHVGIACDLFKSQPHTPDSMTAIDLLAALSVADHPQLHQRQFQLVLQGTLAQQVITKNEAKHLLKRNTTPTRAEAALWVLEHLEMTGEKLFTQSLFVLINHSEKGAPENFLRLLDKLLHDKNPSVMTALLFNKLKDSSRKALAGGRLLYLREVGHDLPPRVLEMIDADHPLTRAQQFLDGIEKGADASKILEELGKREGCPLAQQLIARIQCRLFMVDPQAMDASFLLDNPLPALELMDVMVEAMHRLKPKKATALWKELIEKYRDDLQLQEDLIYLLKLKYPEDTHLTKSVAIKEQKD